MKREQANRAQDKISMAKVVAHPPERVWQALTDPQALAQWLLPTTFKPELRHRFHFKHLSKAGRSQKVRCQVVELDAPHRIAYTWQAEDEAAPSLVTWTLEAVAEGTCLRLEHTALETSCAYSGGSNAFSINGIMNSLADFLDVGGLPARWRLPRMGRIVLQTSARQVRCVSQKRRVFHG